MAIQLEEERLVKIRDVLKELPSQHYRTLEFLMRHLVRVASFSSETNMHARNLAIVWAPNLLRSVTLQHFDPILKLTLYPLIPQKVGAGL